MQATQSAALDLLHQQASAEWPDFSVPRADFLAYVVGRVPEGRSLEEAAGSLHPADLYLACACSRGETRALHAFDATYGGEIERAFARVRPAGLAADDARQILRQKLFVGTAERPPRILEYAGRGSLRGWIRMTAIRTLIDLARERSDQARERALDDVLLFDLPSNRASPELALLQSQCRVEFRASVEEAVVGLTPRQRNLLRQHLLHGLTIDQMGALYRVHRSTCARWLEAARDDLVRATRDHLARRLGVRPPELEEIMQLVASQLDITFQRVLAAQSQGG